jgi:hypothetical protein
MPLTEKHTRIHAPLPCLGSEDSLPRLPAPSHDYLLPPMTTCSLPRLPAAFHDYLLPTPSPSLRLLRERPETPRHEVGCGANTIARSLYRRSLARGQNALTVYFVDAAPHLGAGLPGSNFGSGPARPCPSYLPNGPRSSYSLVEVVKPLAWKLV